MTDKMTIPTASWITLGDYHHHLAFNHWRGSLDSKKSTSPGLNFLTITFEDQLTFEDSYQKAQLQGMKVSSKSKNSFTPIDPYANISKVTLKV
ncbi:hypothetical protein [Streptococcus porcinus]